ncbi:MAG: hypothetical protein WC879_03365 [Melioribacteraceae bacterium]
MGSFSDYAENKILDHVFGGGDFTRPATVYIALLIAAPNDASTGTTIAAPVNAAFTAGAGTLAIGTYYYRVTALTPAGETTPSAETSLALAAIGGVNVNWGAVAGATGYKIYGRSTGAELLIASVGAVTTYLDNGSITPAGAMPIVNTTGIAEATYTGYARKAVTNNATNFPAASGGSKSNGTEIAFAECTAGSSALTHFAVVDAATLGNVLGWGALTTPKTIDAGDTPRFPAGTLTITQD